MGDDVGTSIVGDAVGAADAMGAGLTNGENVMGAKGVNVCLGGMGEVVGGPISSAALGEGAADVVCATTMSTADMFDIAKNTIITHFDIIPSLHCR